MRHSDRERSNRIFVVHGHDNEMKHAVARMLEKLDLEPIILHEEPNKSRTIIEKFTEYSDVPFAVVLLSPDDCAYSRDGSPDDVRPRARQNVIFELGFFIGALGRNKVVAVYRSDPNFDMPTDYSGVLFVPYDESDGWQFDLTSELSACDEYEIDANKLLKNYGKRAKPNKEQKTYLSDEEQVLLFKLYRESSKHANRPDPEVLAKMFPPADKEMQNITQSLQASGLVKSGDEHAYVKITPEGIQYVQKNLSNKKIVQDLATEEGPSGKLNVKLKTLPDGRADLATREYLVDIGSEKERRDAFLCKLYDFVDRVPDKWATGVEDAAREWGYSSDEIERYANYFSGKTYLQLEKAKGHPVAAVKITSFGIDYIESLSCAKLM